jgi:putative hydrolase of the HAD superfamily
MPPALPGVVVFDLGGVVVRICRSWQEGTARAGLPFHPEIMDPERLAARKALVRRYETGEIGCEEFFAAVSASMGGRYTPGEVRRVHDLWITGEYVGVGSLIEDLHALGLQTGVLSNTNAHHWRQQTAGEHGPALFPTPQRVKHLHASHLLRLTKPQLAIFRAFEQATGFGPGQIVYFDDLAENIAGARGAGWDAHLIDHTQETVPQMRQRLQERGVGV